MANTIHIPVSVGELIDKITILEIKVHRLDGERRSNVEKELALLNEQLEAAGLSLEAGLRDQLKEVNTSLWEIEDRIRACEARGAFGEEFIALARQVYRQNDRRAALKRRINQLCGSALVEEKMYTSY
jgi:hypothetical protein